MNGHPGLRISIERVQGCGAVILQRIEIVDQCESSALVGILRNGQYILCFCQIVLVVAIRQYFRSGVGNPRLINIGINLIARRDLRKTAALRQKFGRVFVALVAVEDADRNADVEAITAQSAAMVVFPFEGRVRRAVGISKLYVRICNVDSRLRGLIVRTVD